MKLYSGTFSAALSVAFDVSRRFFPLVRRHRRRRRRRVSHRRGRRSKSKSTQGFCHTDARLFFQHPRALFEGKERERESGRVGELDAHSYELEGFRKHPQWHRGN